MGGRGNDVVQGGEGNDVLSGGMGDDTIVFNRGDGRDYLIPDITDPLYFTSGYDEGYDTLRLGVDPLDLIFSKSLLTLDVSINRTSDSITIADPLGSTGLVDAFQASDGRVLLNNQVDQLIQAMASFCSDNHLGSWSQAIQRKPDEVRQVLSNFWQQQN